jgi:hypothetical protein
VKIATIHSNWIQEEGRRLDPGPYMGGAIRLRKAAERLPHSRLADVTAGFRGGIFTHSFSPKRSYVADRKHGVPFLGASSMLYADLSDLPLLSNRDAESRSYRSLTIHEGMTLISCSGSVGRMTFARPDMEGMASAGDLLKIQPDPRRIPPGYLYAFLRSSVGTVLVTGGTYGTIIQHLEASHVADLPVPRLGKEFESKIHSLVSSSAKLMADFQAGITKATSRLFSSVGLQDISAADWHRMGRDLGFSVQSRALNSLRALNFSPRFRRLTSAIESAPHRKLGNIVLPGSLRRGNRFKRIDAAPAYSYQLIGQRELFWVKPEGRWIAKSATGKDVLVEPGTILVAAQGTLGESELYCRAEFIWGPATKLAYSEHLLRVVADEEKMPAGCLYAFMRSETAFRMLRSISTGTKLQDHHPEMRAEFPVPYPSKSVRDEVHHIVIGAYEARHKAVALEDQAIEIVEDAIEKGSH